MSNLITISGVRGFIDENGTAHLNLEDVARGLGFTEKAASGNEVVRWARLRSYLGDFNFIATSGDGLTQEIDKDTFIPENIFYRLAMKAKNETAEKFQALVADEILPTIRKTGTYSVPKAPAKPTPTLGDANTAAQIILPTLDSVGIRPEYKAYTVKQIYRMAGLDLPMIGKLETDEKIFELTQIAQRLGIVSESGKPHGQAIGAIIAKLEITEDERRVITVEANGSPRTSYNYTESVIDKVSEWLKTNGYPNHINFIDSKGNPKTFKVSYKHLEIKSDIAG